MSKLAFVNAHIDGILNELSTLEATATDEKTRTQYRAERTAIASWAERYKKENKGREL